MHILSPVTDKCLFSNQRNGKNDCRDDFMINFRESYVAKLGLELVISGSAIRCATDCTIKPGYLLSLTYELV